MRIPISLRPLFWCALALAFPAADLSFAQRGASHLLVAQQCAAKGRWKQAEEEARLHLREQPGDETATLLRANALIRLSQPFDAALDLEDFLKVNPDSAAAGKLYAAVLVDVIQDRAKAEQVLLHCSQVAPKDPEVWEGLGRLYLARHQETDAVRCFREAVRLSPADPGYAAGLALSLESDKQLSAAQRQYEKALRLNAASRAPKPIVYVLYANSLATANRFRESVTYYTRALLLDPHSSDAYQGRAFAHEKLGAARNAEADALAALRESPGRRDSRQLLLRVYRTTNQADKLQQRAEELEKLVQSEQTELAHGREMRAALNAAEGLLAKGRFAEAIPAYERVVAANSSFYEAYLALGVCYQQTGETVKAEASLRKYLSFQPLSADGHATLGLLLVAAGRPAEARTELERSLLLNAELVEPRKALAHQFLSQLDFTAAASAAAPLIVNGGGDAESHFLAASARRGTGDTPKAIEICEAGLRANPRDRSLEELHAALLLDCGTTENCKRKALDGLRRNPSSPAYLKTVASMMIDASPIDGATAEIANRVRATLPNDPAALYLYARWALGANQLDLALRESERLAAMPEAGDSLRARACALVGISEDRLGNVEKAETAFRLGLEQNRKLAAPEPRSALPYVDFLIKQSREAEADQLAVEILGWSPAFAPARLRHATHLANSGRLADAVAEANLALKYAGGDLVLQRGAHALLAKTYMSMDRPAQAKTHQDWIVAH